MSPGRRDCSRSRIVQAGRCRRHTLPRAMHVRQTYVNRNLPQVKWSLSKSIDERREEALPRSDWQVPKHRIARCVEVLCNPYRCLGNGEWGGPSTSGWVRCLQTAPSRPRSHERFVAVPEVCLVAPATSTAQAKRFAGFQVQCYTQMEYMRG